MSDFEVLEIPNNIPEKKIKRISQRVVVPGGIVSTKLGNVIFKPNDATITVAASNGAGFDLNFSLSHADEFELLAVPYISLYVGSVTAANSLFPGVGASQNITQWQITGPAYSWNSWSGNNYPRNIEYVTMRVHNISAGSVNVLVRATWRYISPERVNMINKKHTRPVLRVSSEISVASAVEIEPREINAVRKMSDKRKLQPNKKRML